MSHKSKSSVKEKIKINFWDKWTVELINSQQWSFEETKKKNSPKKGASPTPTVPTINYFCDNEIVILPQEYQSRIAGWKRPMELFPNVDITEIENYVSLFQTPMSVDVFQLNSHLNDCGYYSHIMNSIEGLFLYPRWNSSNFEEFGFAKWEPQNHIYSVTKITSETPHYPEFNKYGKYIVRLFHCGKWRAITVDDRIPLDKDNIILIPCLKYESKIYLWLLLLVKAILKLNEYRKENKDYYMLVGETTYKCDEEIAICCYCDRGDMTVEKTNSDNERNLFEKLNVVTLFTAWNPVKTTFFDNNEEEIWNYLYELIEVFKYPVKLKKGEIIVEKEYPLIMMQMDFENFNCFELSLLAIRDIPIEPKPSPPELTPWKQYRWLDWAIEHGIYAINPPDLYHSLAFTIGQSRIDLIQKYIEPDWYDAQLKAPTAKDKKEKKGASSKGSKTSKGKTLPSANNSTTSTVATASPVIKLPIWLKFNLIKENIKTLIAFNQNKLYKYNIFITNETVEVVGKKVDGKKSTKSVKAQEIQIIDENESIVQEFIYNKNNYVYIFIDNLQDILAVITLTNMKMHSTEFGCVVCETIHWDSNLRMRFFEIKLLNQSCERIIFPKGRHIYRLEIQLNNYNIHIQTNGLIKICNDYELFLLMVVRPLRFVEYFNQLSDKFKLLIENIGTDDYKKFMQEFFHQILYNFNPLNMPTTINKQNIYELFLENFIEINKNLMQKLFVYKYWIKNNNFDFCYNKKVCLNMMMIYNLINSKEYLCECDRNMGNGDFCRIDNEIQFDGIIDTNKSKYFDKYFNFIVNNYAATIIQKIFKMNFIQLLIKNYHKVPAAVVDTSAVTASSKGNKSTKGNKSGKNIKSVKLEKSTEPDKSTKSDKTSKAVKTVDDDTQDKINKFQLNKDALSNDFYEMNFQQKPEIIFKFLLENFFTKTLSNNKKLLNYYEFANDLEYNYVNLYELNGVIKVLAINQISLVLQGCFKCHNMDDEKRIYLIKFGFLDLKISNIINFVNIIDNDTNEEIFINKNNLIKLSSNRNGYTIIVYYFVIPQQVEVQSKQSKGSLFLTNVKWRLYIISRYNVNKLHLCLLCKFIKHTMLSCKCEVENEDLEPILGTDCDNKITKIYVNYINYSMYWPNIEKQILYYTLLVGDSYLLTLFFNTSNLDIYFYIKIWVKSTDEIIFKGLHKGFVTILNLFLLNEMKEPSVEKLPEVPAAKGGKGKPPAKISKGKTPKGAGNMSAQLEKKELERYNNWVSNPVYFTEYCLQIELRDEWELNEHERQNIYNSQHEVINEMIRIEEEEALNEKDNDEATAKASVISANAETTKIQYPHTSTLDNAIEKPFWNLQINYPQNSLIIVQPDRTIEDKIIEVKKLWQKTGILDMGEYVRNEFVDNQQKLIDNFMDPCSSLNAHSKEIFVNSYQYEDIGSSTRTVTEEANDIEASLIEHSEPNLSNISTPKLIPFCAIYNRLADIIMANVNFE